MRWKLVPALFAALAAGSAARADVIYSFVGGASLAGTTYTIDSPGFLPYSSASIAATGTLYLSGVSQGAISAVEFFSPTNMGIAATNGSSGFTLSYDPTHAGTYTSVYGYGTLTVTNLTPEPSSLALLGTGLLGAIGVTRRRLA